MYKMCTSFGWSFHQANTGILYFFKKNCLFIFVVIAMISSNPLFLFYMFSFEPRAYLK